MEAFISYSHRDEQYLERLKVHLTQAKRDGLISDWTDQEITTGSNLDNSIANVLLSSQLFIAIVSPDYIASNYCYEKEFSSALKMQEEGRLIIVPIIVEPCDWQNTPFGKLKAIPKDGKPISEYTNMNVAFLNVVDELRRLIKLGPITINSEKNSIGSSENNVKRNYKVKKFFTEVDKVNFIEESFKKIVLYFKTSINEINDVENIQAKLIKDNEAFFTCLISNRSNSQNCYLTVSLTNSKQMRSGDLQYSFSDRVNETSMNMSNLFKVEKDDYNLFWKRNDSYTFYRIDEAKQLNPTEIAEMIWNDFIEQVGVS